MSPNIQNSSPLHCISTFLDIPVLTEKGKISPMSYDVELDHERSLLEQRSLLDQANKILDLLNDYDQNSLITEACEHAINVTFTFMAEDFSKKIEKLQSEIVGDKHQRFQILLSLQRQKYFLDVVEHVLTSTDHRTALLISSKVKSVNEQLETVKPEQKGQKASKKTTSNKTISDGGLNMPAISISAWMTPMVVFDIAVAKPAIYCSSVQPLGAPDINSGLAAAAQVPTGTTELPCEMEVRTITNIFTEETVEHKVNRRHSLVNKSENYDQQAYSVEILSCLHVACDERYCSGILGEITLLLTLYPIGENSNATVLKRARAIQTNASPQQIDNTLDIFTSSAEGDANVEIFLHFQTRRCISNEYPKIIVELAV